jgi:serine/threonine-protein kinase
MEYIEGASLSHLWKAARQRGVGIPVRVVSAIMSNVLHGLHAAHETTNERGEPLDIVHRDVSPHNILVGADGVARLLDFGVAKASGRLQTTKEGQIKGKLAYMAPEQLRRGAITRRTDISGASVVLWEALTGERLFSGDDEGSVLEQVLLGLVDPPSKFSAALGARIDEICARGLERAPNQRFGTAREMAVALEDCVPPALPSEIGEWVRGMAGDELRARARLVNEVETAAREDATPTGPSRRSPPARMNGHDDATMATVTASETRHRRRSSRTGWAVGATGLAVALLAIVASQRHTAPAAAVPTEQRAPHAVDDQRASDDRAPTGLPSTTPTPELASVVAMPTTRAAPDAGKPAAAARAPARRPSTTKATRTSSVGCTPPYTVDATGRMIFKRECL